MYFLTDTLTEMSFYQIGLIIKAIANITLIIVPIIVIITSMMELFKLVLKPDSPAQTIKILTNKIIAGLAIFLLPTIINYTFTLIENYNSNIFLKYYTESSIEKINALKAQYKSEQIALAAKEKAKLKEAQIQLAEKERKRMEQIEEIRKQQEEQSQNNGSSNQPGSSGSWSGDSQSSGSFGSVRVENGVFYIPNKRATSDSDIPKQSGQYGLNPIFWERLNKLISDAAKEGYTIGVTSGWRSYSSQRSLWDRSTEPCSTRNKWVSCPGGSRHGFGIAADLSFNGSSCSGGWDCNDAARWVHANAGNYGLTFRLSWEAWHIEPSQISGGNFGACTATC